MQVWSLDLKALFDQKEIALLVRMVAMYELRLASSHVVQSSYARPTIGDGDGDGDQDQIGHAGTKRLISDDARMVLTDLAAKMH